MISAVRQYLRKTRKLVIKLLNHLRGALAVMNIGLMNRDGHWEAKCADHNVFLASFDFLVPVNALAGRVSVVGGLHASGVYDSHAGTLVPACDFASKGMFSCSYLRIDDFFR